MHIFKKVLIFILTTLGLCCCMRAVSLQQSEATLHSGVQGSCRGFPCGGAHTLGEWALAVVARGLSNSGSVAVAPVLRCPVACGVFPQQRPNLCLSHRKADS